jgi:hypothetical protein
VWGLKFDVKKVPIELDVVCLNGPVICKYAPLAGQLSSIAGRYCESVFVEEPQDDVVEYWISSLGHDGQGTEGKMVEAAVNRALSQSFLSLNPARLKADDNRKDQIRRLLRVKFPMETLQNASSPSKTIVALACGPAGAAAVAVPSGGEAAVLLSAHSAIPVSNHHEPTEVKEWRHVGEVMRSCVEEMNNREEHRKFTAECAGVVDPLLKMGLVLKHMGDMRKLCAEHPCASPESPLWTEIKEKVVPITTRVQERYIRSTEKSKTRRRTGALKQALEQKKASFVQVQSVHRLATQRLLDKLSWTVKKEGLEKPGTTVLIYQSQSRLKCTTSRFSQYPAGKLEKALKHHQKGFRYASKKAAFPKRVRSWICDDHDGTLVKDISGAFLVCTTCKKAQNRIQHIAVSIAYQNSEKKENEKKRPTNSKPEKESQSKRRRKS